jgi:integrase/recombinase XerD
MLLLSQKSHPTLRVNLIKKIKLGNDWRFAPVVPEPNGKLKDKVLVNGQVEVHPEGSYYIEWREDGRRGRRFREKVFKEDAIERARRKALELEASRQGLIPTPVAPQATQPISRTATQPAQLPQAPLPEKRVTIGKAIDDYLEFTETHRKKRTFTTYRYTLDTLLRGAYKKTFVDEATREDIIAFMTYCFKKGLGNRTVYDKLVVVLQLFKRYGKARLIEKSDWPEYVEAIRPIYEAEELEAMFRVATEDEATLVKFLLASGLRDQEIRFLLWRDIDFRHSLVRITAKPQWGYSPKNWEERAVPLPNGILERLKALKVRRDAVPTKLVFPSRRGNPDSGMDMIVKRLARRAGLNCGQCVTKHGNKCSLGPHCQNFFLHKFRHTFATEHLRHGIDIRTLQAWMGHRDIKSTMVYLKGVQSKDALVKVNAGSIAAYAV